LEQPTKTSSSDNMAKSLQRHSLSRDLDSPPLPLDDDDDDDDALRVPPSRQQPMTTSSLPSPPRGAGGRSQPIKPTGDNKLAAKRQRRLRVEHFDFAGVDADPDIAVSDLNFDESIEEEHSQSEELSEGEDWLVELDNTGLKQMLSYNLRTKPKILPLKALEHKMKETARDLKRKSNARFRCPLHSCNMTLPPSTTSKDFWTHASDKEQTHGLYMQGWYRCELGCKENFTDNLGLIYYYAMQKCAIETLPDYDCTKDECPGSVDNGTATRMQHWFRVHAPDAYASKDTIFNDEACELGSPRKSLLHYHLWGECECVQGCKIVEAVRPRCLHTIIVCPPYLYSISVGKTSDIDESSFSALT
ncbi:hypothetical protein KCU90_g74, partial [Aureobasidium melanogenum]